MHGRDDLLHHLDRAWRAGHDAGPERGQIEVFEIGVAEQRDEHGRHAIEPGAAFLRDSLQCGAGIKPLARKDHGGALGDAAQRAHHHAETMIQRHGNAQPVLIAEMNRCRDEIAVVDDVVVGERGALRRAGRARGELDVTASPGFSESEIRSRRSCSSRPPRAMTSPKLNMPGELSSPMRMTISSLRSRAALSWPGSALASSGASVSIMPR